MSTWLHRLLGAPDVPLAEARWIVVDCETSGLDANRDRLLSIGAVRVRGGRIPVGEAFSALLRQDRASDVQNILVHGIGGAAQRSGDEPASALQAFEQFADQDLPVAFHAPFDRKVLERAIGEVLGHPWKRKWIDLARLLPALFAQQARTCRLLDEWLAAFAIAPQGRHDALGDAFATAQLLQVALAQAARQRVRGIADLVKTEREARWLA